MAQGFAAASPDAVLLSGIREVLTANRTYYVATTGSDSNDGLTSGNPFLTIQKAINIISDSIDLNGFKITIQVADGTYGAIILKSLVGAVGYTSSTVGNPLTSFVEIVGNTVTPTNVLLTTAIASTHTVLAEGSYPYYISGVSLTTTGSGLNTVLALGGTVHFGNVNFGACTTYHLATGRGGFIQMLSNYSINGGAAAHWQPRESGIIDSRGRTITITGTPAFGSAFALADLTGVVRCSGITFSGSATGMRYVVNTNGVVDTGGAGATYLPGSLAGSAATGGQYV
jgi:hypothetical protein